MISLIPMAGTGSRFSKEGYRLLKPFIPVMKDEPMFISAIRSFPKAEKYIFVCMEQFKRYLNFSNVRNLIQRDFKESMFLFTEQITEGQACTCLLAEDYLDKDDSLLISSIDYQIVFDHEKFVELTHDDSIDVGIFTFLISSITKKNPEAFAYCVVNNEVVTEVVEKRTISSNPNFDPAVVGTFYYRRAEDFVTSAKRMIKKNIRVNNEFYVGTSINQLIEMGEKVVIFPVKSFISFGDPFELELYRFWEEFFFNENRQGLKGKGF